jgi:hypothetical protein
VGLRADQLFGGKGLFDAGCDFYEGAVDGLVHVGGGDVKSTSGLGYGLAELVFIADGSGRTKDDFRTHGVLRIRYGAPEGEFLIAQVTCCLAGGLL